jgi:hypothetical protein
MHQIGGEKESTKTSPFLLNSPRIGESQNYGSEMKRLIPPMDGNRLLRPRGGAAAATEVKGWGRSDAGGDGESVAWAPSYTTNNLTFYDILIFSDAPYMTFMIPSECHKRSHL